jgi:hypothetical protein
MDSTDVAQGEGQFFQISGTRRSCLPPVLQGKNLSTAHVQKMAAKGSKDSRPDQEEHQEKKNKSRGPKQEAEIPNPTSKPSSVVTPGKSSKKISSPIVSVTPLQSTKGILDAQMDFRRRNNAYNYGRVTSERIFLR